MPLEPWRMLALVSAPFPDPTVPAQSSAEVFLRYLDYFRARVISKIEGLPESELRQSRLPSGWTPIELLKHLIYVELRWLEWRFEGRTITDPWGASTNCTQTITVNDTTPPTLTGCPPSLTVQCLSEVPPRASVVASDNCDGSVQAVFDETFNGPPCNLTITRTWTATDNCGNAARCIQTITVMDNTPPVVQCPGDISLAADVGKCSKSNVAYAASATDNCDPNPAVVCDPPSGSTFPVGNNSVICTATDACGNKSTCSFTITVLDKERPAIICSQDLTVECSGPNGTPVSFNTTATDNCPGVAVFCSMASGSRFPLGTTAVHCAAFDQSGNGNACTFTITVADTMPPVITCPANMTVNCTQSDGAVATYSPSATDNCDGNLTATCTPPSGSVFAQGTTTVTCTASDHAGHSSSCSFTVTVVEPPVSLRIELSGGVLGVSWPVTCGGYVLERTFDLDAPIDWNPVSGSVVVENGRYVYKTSIGLAMRYFRLHKR